MYIVTVVLTHLVISAHCTCVPRGPYSCLNNDHPPQNGIDWSDRRYQYDSKGYEQVNWDHPFKSYDSTYTQQQSTRRRYDDIGLMPETDDVNVNELLGTILTDLQHSSHTIRRPVLDTSTNADLLTVINKIVSSLSTSERLQMLKLVMSAQDDSLLSKVMIALVPAMEYVDWSEFISILSPVLRKTNIIELGKLIKSYRSVKTSDLIMYLMPSLQAPGKRLQVNLLVDLVEGPLLNVAQDITSGLSKEEWFQLIRYLIKELTPVIKRIKFSSLIGNGSPGLDGKSIVHWIKVASPYLSRMNLGNLARLLNKGLEDTDITQLLLNIKDFVSRIGISTSDEPSQNVILDSATSTVYQSCEPTGQQKNELQLQVQRVLRESGKPSCLSKFKLLAVKIVSQGQTVLIKHHDGMCQFIRFLTHEIQVANTSCPSLQIPKCDEPDFIW
ncbi:hypothetical protein EG68_05793 [Paragonimus skrjabini miyazakii]|uniref:Vitellogenin domain-containing protein n=1 Tax=Paragonimus skrjabini miyazakii TaxID=59628 RepID=A0A8S9YY17_9TREM|nr:hypothetical protein EG68_05793 [Paragonimus skrjabini miyazakii]